MQEEYKLVEKAMIMQSVGIRSLAVRFPHTIRTNHYWLQKFPELSAQTIQRQARLPRSVELMSNQNGLDVWLQEVNPYLSDPFRGSVERRVLASDESSLMLECHAAQDALAAAKLSAEEVDLAIIASLFPDTVGPGLAAHFARELGLRCPAWNLESTCSSALIALQTAQAFLQTGAYRHILVVVSHIGSRTVNEADTLSWSMGDGAGAFVVGFVKPTQGILSTKIIPTTATCGAYVHDLVIDSQGKPWIQTCTGETVSILAETAVDFVRHCCQEAVTAAGVSLEQINFFAFNTPTAWYASVCAKALGIDPGRVIDLYPLYANIGPVFPVANLYHAVSTGKICENDLVLVYANGAAATAAATVIRWGDVALGSAPTEPLRTPQATQFSDEPRLAVTAASCLKENLLVANFAERYSILEAYLLEWLATRQLSPSEISTQQLLSTLLDSLMAIVFRSQIETDLQIRVPMEMFFGDSTIRHLTNFLLNQLATSKSLVNDLPVIVPAPELRHEPFPLTDMQHAFWIGRSGVLELGNVSNHGYYEIEGHGLDLERLNTTLQRLIERHDMLRAVVLPDGQQQILKDVPAYQIEVLDLRGQDQATIATRLEAIRQLMSHQVLPAEQYPLFDFRVSCLDGDRIRLHVSYDLLVFDAWSLFRLFEEWFQLYQSPDCILPPLNLSFRDYVLAEQSLPQTQLYQRSQDYWLNRIDTLPPAPELPLTKNPKELKQHHCRRYNGQMEPADWQLLKQKATNIGLTPSGLLLAAFAEILTLWSNPQFTLNLALFNRLPIHPQVNNILGDFTSVTLLAVDNVSADESFRDRAIRIQKQLWQDLEHRYFSGVRVMREITRRKGTVPSAMPVVFTSTLGFAAIGQETLTFSHFGELVYGISQASQAWMDVQVWEEKETLTFNWDVVEELFPEGMIADMFAAYCCFLKRLVDSESIWVETTRQLLPAAQLAQRNAVNATDAPIPDALLHELFANQVRQHPDQTAVISDRQTLTYQSLCDRSNQVGHRLRHLGAKPNQLIGIVMDKGWEQIVAVMGILAAGAAYVPIAPELPPERLQYLLKNSEIEIVLTQSWLNATLPWTEGIQRFCIDSEDFASESIDPLKPVQTPDDLAYVIYTSGSTGLPKGVMITHRNVANVVVYTNQRFQVGRRDRILAVTALNHDLSVYDIFGLLSAGGAIVLPDAASVKNPHHWADLIQRQQVTLWNSVPAMMEMLVNALHCTEALSSSLRLAILGGDWLPVSLPSRLKALVPDIDLLSIGGPTETTIWNIGYQVNEVNPTWKSIPYGQPMVNSKYYILNAALEDCPVWVPGQMYCAGVQLAKGYWRDEEKTHAHFITHLQTGERLYRSGDLGRYLPDGNIEFLRRVDFQIKLRGYRIEAGEIEAALLQHPAVQAAVVKAIEQAHLVAYVVPSGAVLPTVDELSQLLGSKLPDYMVPSMFLFLDALPLSANGKVDRQALPTQDARFQTRVVAYTAPQNEIEQTIAVIFQAVLELEKVGVNDNFFDLGANSLLITTIYRELGTVLPQEMQAISLVDLFSYPTVKTLAQRLTQAQKVNVLEQQRGEAAQKLSQGKNRLKQRFEKSRLTQE